MRIEDEIKQNKFADEYQKALINLLFTHGFIANKITRELKKHSITRQQYNILRILRGNKGNTYNISDIRVRMIEKMSDVSRIIDRLEKKSLVKKVTHSRDKRVTEIYITDKGLKALSKIDPIIEKVGNTFKNLSDTEVEKFNECLDKIRQ